MKTWKITLEYDGTRYSGWQEQINARTVMAQLRKAAEEVFEAKVELQGSGRTDAGVHALAQVAHLRTDSRRRLLPAAIAREINELIPADMAVLLVEEAPPRFHARHDAVSRSYVYQISTRKNAFAKRHVWWVKEKLDTDIMARAAAMLAGRHDFTCFRAQDPSKPDDSPIVVVEMAEIEKHEDLILFRIEASHFVWRMVRRIVGVLVKLGKGDIAVEDFEKLLNAKCDPRLKVSEWTAPAAGLFLERVRYR
ncbi:MAG TPA: tRNA pseudouridine(38-40) synthase TruA [Bryobacteraceae bacterium]|nr:tRNA pseudouridine(38-40) synthase TruA [Bryobacteraceae bacterium]